MIIVKILRIIVKGLFYLSVGYFIYFVSLFIPRNRNIWVFGSWFGNKFADNSKYLFLYVKKFHPEIRAIWLTLNLKLIKKLREERQEADKTYRIKGFLYPVKDGCSISPSGLVDINRFAITVAKKAQLWHGALIRKI